MTTPPPWDHHGFTEYIIGRAKDLGIATSTNQLAAATGIGRSMLSKWFAGHERPHPRSLERLAVALKVEPVDMLAAAGYSKEQPASPPAVDPDIERLSRLLGPRTPIAPAKQDELRAMLVRMMDLYEHEAGRRRSA